MNEKVDKYFTLKFLHLVFHFSISFMFLHSIYECKRTGIFFQYFSSVIGSSCLAFCNHKCFVSTALYNLYRVSGRSQRKPLLFPLRA